jgi:hypothetical protein
MVKPIPENIKTLLSELSSTQQVALRGYIASLRTEVKDLEAELLAKSDPDPHAHYHGDQKCTIDHGHEGHHDHDHVHHHGDQKCTIDHGHGGHDHKDHDHKHHDHKEHDHAHHNDHKDHDHKHHEHKDHDHKHHEHKDHDHKDHGHDGHEHKHHDHVDHDEMPAWKKKALESGSSDPSQAPFGGDWNSETIRNLNEDKMEE